jgi:pimeloyl-ACP methyl ester carboxylesterase
VQIFMSMSPASHAFYSQRLRLHYLDWGNESAPTLLFVHGIQDHCRTWDALATELADDYHIIAPDLRGHGDSQWLQGSGYHYLDYIYDLHQLIKHANLSPVVLVGHSMGGAIAALFAGIYPELISKLVLIEGIGLWRELQAQIPVHERARNWIETTHALSGRLPKRYQSLDEAHRRMLRANPQLSEGQALHLTTHGSIQNEDGSYSWKYDNYTHHFSPDSFDTKEMIELWQRIDCPVQIINADNGLPHRIGQDDTQKYFDNSEIVLIENASHWTYHDRHETVVTRIKEFLCRHP